MIDSAIPAGTPFYTSGPTLHEVEKKMKKFRPYFSEIKELVDQVDQINLENSPLTKIWMFHCLSSC